MSKGSIPFDRAADYYDASRSLPAGTDRAQTKLLLPEIHGDCLEIGIGTGRIAVPLAAAGIRIVGVDLAHPMLEVLRTKTPTVPAALADARRLPFSDRTFTAVVAAHVLHLISDWPRAVDEVVRVVQPGGVLLATHGGHPGALDRELRRRIITRTGGSDAPVGINDLSELDSYARQVGLTPRQLAPLQTLSTYPAQVLLDTVEQGLWSWTWDMDPQLRAEAVEEARAWLHEVHGDPAEVMLAMPSITWRAYDKA